MLIPSDRHRPIDLTLWREQEEADLIHGQSPRVTGLINRSLEAIRDFTTHGPCYTSVSWGKDSVVTAWLVARAAPSVPLAHLRVSSHRNPDCDLVRDTFLAKWPRMIYHEVPIDYGDVHRSVHAADTRERELDRKFYAGFQQAGERYGHRHISGIRADESSGRKIRMRRWGLASRNALAPLGWWTATDVFGVLAAEELPVHPCYAMLGGGRWERGQIRVDELGGARGDQFGRAEWEQEYYGDVLRRLSKGR